jgi:hypothetical protein
MASNSQHEGHREPIATNVTSTSEGLHATTAATAFDKDEYCEIRDDFGCLALENYRERRDKECGYQWIRMEKKPSECFDSISTKKDVFRKIEQVKQEQSRFGRSDLYTRRWQLTTEPSRSAQGPPINGETVNSAVSPLPASFSVVQFNALAEGLCSGPDDKSPFPLDSERERQPQSDKACYGGFTSIDNPEITLGFERRRWRLLEAILGGGIVSEVGKPEQNAPFDLIAMEEVDRFHGFFAPALRLFGYEGLFMPKARAPGVRMGWYSDGCCFFFKKEVFELVAVERGNYTLGNQVYIVATLRHRASHKSVVVAVTHLKAQCKNEMIRCIQVDELLRRAEHAASQVKQNEGQEVPVLIIGDLNADPPGYFDKSDDESSVERILNHPSPHFRSAYEVDPPFDSFYTTYKVRGSNTAKRIIDYIFYSGGVQCKAALQIPSQEELEPIPSLRYPSDHLLIAAMFDL